VEGNTLLSQTYQEQVAECTRFLAPRLERPPEWGIVLGTGQGQWDSRLEGGECLPYEALPHFPPATSPGHHGRLCWGRLAGRQVMVCQGRFHAYEGYSMGQVTFPVRVMATLGVKTLVLTNAAGGLNPHFRPGELMLICDHINFMGDNPLVGPNLEAWGPRFPDLSRVYDLALRELAAEVARRQGTVLRQGVYVAVKGPSLETPAETRFLRMMGADAVGMSHRARSHLRGARRPKNPGDLGDQQPQPAGRHGPHCHRGYHRHGGPGRARSGGLALGDNAGSAVSPG
jgi:purine-nucleoside phosphorylase